LVTRHSPREAHHTGRILLVEDNPVFYEIAAAEQWLGEQKPPT
jgi:hypothetical protein